MTEWDNFSLHKQEEDLIIITNRGSILTTPKFTEVTSRNQINSTKNTKPIIKNKTKWNLLHVTKVLWCQNYIKKQYWLPAQHYNEQKHENWQEIQLVNRATRKRDGERDHGIVNIIKKIKQNQIF